MTTLMVPTVEPAREEDTDAILALLYSRPGSFAETWHPVDGAQVLVVRDAQGIAAFAMGRAFPNQHMVIVDQVELEWSADGPTRRGRRALAAFERWLHQEVEARGWKVVSVVSSENERHMVALRARGYREVARVFIRETKG